MFAIRVQLIFDFRFFVAQLNIHEKAFLELGSDNDPFASVEQWMGTNQRHESDTWLLREILAYKCRAKESVLKSSNNTSTTSSNSVVSLTIPQALLECLLQTLIMLRRENERLVEKSKEQLASTRLEKASEERFEALKEQLMIKDEMIGDLKADVSLWQEKYLSSTETNQKLIEQTNSQQIECNNRMLIVQKANEDLQALVQQTEKENQSLQNENRYLNGELFKVQAEVEALKKSEQSMETLRKERLCCQQKVHVVSERLYQCKQKLEECQAELRNKEALSELQAQQVQHLQANVNQLRCTHDQLSAEVDRSRSRADEMEKQLTEFERQRQQTDEHGKSHRMAELQLQRETLHSLLSINSAYEAELLELRAQLALYEYELKNASPTTFGLDPTSLLLSKSKVNPE